jgi:hypothetical protein
MGISVKILGALAVAGMAATGSSAFTGAGLASSAGPDQFIGGTVSQTVHGAVLDSVVYGFTADPTNSKINLVTLTFHSAEVDGKTPTIDPTATGWGGTEVTTQFVCGAVAGGTHVSTCSPKDEAGLASSGGWMSGLSNLDITVPSSL